MRIWGIAAQVHDAAVAVIEDGEIIFAGHAERYSKLKQDQDLHPDLISDALLYGEPDQVAYYESPWAKKSRQFWTGYWKYCFDLSVWPSRYLKTYGIKSDITCFSHHQSHAAAGFYTSPFSEATVLVIDSVGEWQTITIWRADPSGLHLLDSVTFPSSLGLLYSAFTQRCGLKPNEEEYILMGMAAFGKPIYVDQILEDWVDESSRLFRLKQPCHAGIGDYLPAARREDLAASIQVVTEQAIIKVAKEAKRLASSENLVYMGGVALNCVANSLLFEYFENIWIMPNPGDAGSALGCAALLYGKHLRWRGPYLGRNISGEYPIAEACRRLAAGEIVGVAKGRAEYGPRALGNRSLLADPRSKGVKDRVNSIKRRQKYRPFAPAILEELAEEYFDLPTRRCNYMQFVGKCKFPDQFPGVIHVDGTSRVQTVSEKDHPEFYGLLLDYYNKTGCPMLLNTSLNVRGRPIVNDEADAALFESTYGVPVL